MNFVGWQSSKIALNSIGIERVLHTKNNYKNRLVKNTVKIAPRETITSPFFLEARTNAASVPQIAVL